VLLLAIRENFQNLSPNRHFFPKTCKKVTARGTGVRSEGDSSPSAHPFVGSRQHGIMVPTKVSLKCLRKETFFSSRCPSTCCRDEMYISTGDCNTNAFKSQISFDPFDLSALSFRSPFGAKTRKSHAFCRALCNPSPRHGRSVPNATSHPPPCVATSPPQCLSEFQAVRMDSPPVVRHPATNGSGKASGRRHLKQKLEKCECTHW